MRKRLINRFRKVVKGVNLTNREQLLVNLAVETIYDNSVTGKYPDEQEWIIMSLERKLECVSSEIENQLELDQGLDFDGLFYHEIESEAYDFTMDTRNNFMFGTDGWEIGLRTPTVEPMFHLAALKVAANKYPNAF